MTNADQIFQAIRDLPVRERLRLVERVVHDIADTSTSSDPIEQPGATLSPLGLFADDPDGVDEMMTVVMENRRRWKLRSPEAEDEFRCDVRPSAPAPPPAAPGSRGCASP